MPFSSPVMTIHANTKKRIIRLSLRRKNKFMKQRTTFSILITKTHHNTISIRTCLHWAIRTNQTALLQWWLHIDRHNTCWAWYHTVVSRNLRRDFEVVAWLSGNALVSINVVTLRRARLILGWVTRDRMWAGKPSWFSHLGQLSLPGSINGYRQYAGVKAWESPLSGGR